MNMTLTILGIDDSMLIIHTKNTLNTQEYIPYIMNSNNSQSVQAEECDVSKMSATEECSQCKKPFFPTMNIPTPVCQFCYDMARKEGDF